MLQHGVGVVSGLPPSSCCRYQELLSTLHVRNDTSCQLGLMLLWCWVFCLSNNHAVPLCLTQLKEVVLKSGKVLRADVCVVGVGKGLQLRA